MNSEFGVQSVTSGLVHPSHCAAYSYLALTSSLSTPAYPTLALGTIMCALHYQAPPLPPAAPGHEGNSQRGRGIHFWALPFLPCAGRGWASF